jgi:hypothetical protein
VSFRRGQPPAGCRAHRSGRACDVGADLGPACRLDAVDAVRPYGVAFTQLGRLGGPLVLALLGQPPYHRARMSRRFVQTGGGLPTRQGAREQFRMGGP